MGVGEMSQADDVSVERFDLTSLVPKDDRYAVLRDLIPEAFAELELIPEDLAVAMGNRVVDPQEERYGQSWPGRAAAIPEPWS